MTILVTGSRGRVARALIGLLHDRGHAVRASSREAGDLGLPAGTEVVRCALDDPSTFPAALEGVSSVFLYAEPAHIDAFVEEAAQAGVQHVVLLSSVAALFPDAASHLIGRPHLLVEQALTEAPFTSTFLRPGSFATNTLGWAHSIKATGSVNLPHPAAHSDAVHEADLAEAALAVLTDSALAGAAYELSGPESLTFEEQIDRLAHVTGRAITVNVVSPEEWKQEVSAFMPAPFADTLLDLWRRTEGVPLPVTGAAAVAKLTGHPARSFTTWAEDHAADFTA
ncbi:NmrA family transcriptional regulator [Streptomyces cinnamoneus]|uniref:NmrA family transcriptional regulator n=1 Tax=Streptomyces cinnamoneus TaxID=53446 RepID=A0A2G1X9V6_STRCJ|nr:NAD(P)H-binding protein [Streptomyces cinnamoneus]PHQ48024.1 NmrA family transcriptional regulator [Streptomyces cinnamoneus]PPT15650.1 NmrA family transcriptional regulator [Streptomyces cinnamoneus]